jgi:glucosyl-dolichyl phosphate glucuronosyltransferase
MTTSAARDPDAPVLSVIVCTFNRCDHLNRALRALVDQARHPPSYEIVVVDNNSTDRTREVIDRFRSSGLVRAAFEPRQGLSFARNRGVAAASADLVAFTDDDVCVGATWVTSIVDAFGARPDADMIGGKVIPEWAGAPPRWLAAAGYAPLAIADYGDEPFAISSARPVCLIGANVAVRRRAFDRAGGFSAIVQRVGDAIGSTEDYEFQARVMARGGLAVYDPHLVVHAPVEGRRLRKRYHRAWHSGHGRFYALMRDPSFERSRRAVLGVPLHVYRSALTETAQWATSLLTLRGAAAFVHELRLRFLIGFAVQRIFPRT